MKVFNITNFDNVTLDFTGTLRECITFVKSQLNETFFVNQNAVKRANNRYSDLFFSDDEEACQRALDLYLRLSDYNARYRSNGKAAFYSVTDDDYTVTEYVIWYGDDEPKSFSRDLDIRGFFADEFTYKQGV